MKLPMRLIVILILATLGFSIGSSQPKKDLAPLPPIQRIIPGEVQPLAPGQRKAPELPQLTLEPPIAGVDKVEYASNGFIEVAYARVLVSPASTTLNFMLTKAKRVVHEAFQTRPSLNEVDLSIYNAEEYAGFGGPLPRFTVSVPKERLQEFLRLDLPNLSTYDRLWVNDQAFYGPPAPVSDELEQNPKFQGSGAQVKAQQLEQTSASQQGGIIANRLYHGDPNKTIAALTFDDAPHPLYEPLLLDTLRRAGVKATFFVIGRNAQAYPYFVRDMLKDGHEIANHTYHHIRLNDLDEAAIKNEIVLTNDVLEDITGKPVRFFRPPGGRYSPTVLRVMRELNMTIAFWTDDPGDFINYSEGVLESRLLSRLRPGGIVLLHDNVLSTIQVLGSFLKLAEREKIRLGTASDLVRGQTASTGPNVDYVGLSRGK